MVLILGSILLLNRIRDQMFDTLQGAIAGIDGNEFAALARATAIDPNFTDHLDLQR